MDEAALLTLEEAATRSGYRKRDLRALLRDGRLPAVRAGGRWRIATSDLASLPLRTVSQPDPPPPAAVEPPPPINADPLNALVALLRERDHKLAELQEERAQLTGQVGFLLGQLTEREGRIQWLEQAALATSAHQTVRALSADSGPVALIDEWATPSPAIPTIVALDGDTEPAALAGTTDSSPYLESKLTGSVAVTKVQTGDDCTAPITEPGPFVSPASVGSEPAVAPPAPKVPPRRGLFGLFRRRAPG